MPDGMSAAQFVSFNNCQNCYLKLQLQQTLDFLPSAYSESNFKDTPKG